MPDVMLYKAGPMQPVCQAGDTVGLWIGKVWKFAKVTLVEGLPFGSPLVQNLGAIAAGGTVQPVQLTILDMNNYEFGQFRAKVLDDFAAELYLGRADKRFSTKSVNSRITVYTDQVENIYNTTEFFICEDNHAFMAGYNETGYALTQARVAFWGFRYAYEELPNFNIKSPPPTYTRIPAQDF